MNIWYIQVSVSNLNWTYTASGQMFASLYHMVHYCYMSPVGELALEVKVVILVAMFLVSLVFGWIAYFTD